MKLETNVIRCYYLKKSLIYRILLFLVRTILIKMFPVGRNTICDLRVNLLIV